MLITKAFEGSWAVGHEITTKAKIGPNAVTQILSVLVDQGMREEARDIFAAADVNMWRRHPPAHMIDAEAAGRVHAALRARLSADNAKAVLVEAGRRTADYILARRIPGPIKALLRILPADWAAKLLARAIAAHAWTFAGGGQLTVTHGHPLTFELRGQPLCSGAQALDPVCVWHEAVFEGLFKNLVSPKAQARETRCAGQGHGLCRFEVTWR